MLTLTIEGDETGQESANFILAMNDGDVKLHFYVKRSVGNRLRYWLFCKFFPFKIVAWNGREGKDGS